MKHLPRVLLWFPYLALMAVFWLVGLLVIPVLAWRSAWITRPSKISNFKADAIKVWVGGWLTWIWGNEEDGVTGAEWYRELHKDWTEIKQAIFWSAFRNPTNNFRFVPHLNPVIDPVKIRSITWESGDFTWQGVYSGFRWFPKFGKNKFRFWLGWKLKPEDAQGIPDTDFRNYGVGFATQFKRIKE